MSALLMRNKQKSRYFLFHFLFFFYQHGPKTHDPHNTWLTSKHHVVICWIELHREHAHIYFLTTHTDPRKQTAGLYLEHVCVFVMAVLHHHRVVPGQCVGDAVLTFAVHGLKYDKPL